MQVITAMPSASILLVDSSVVPSLTPTIPPGGLPVILPNGYLTVDVTLPPSTSSAALPFPTGVTTALVVYILAVTATDLLINVGPTPFALTLPQGQVLALYSITSAHLSVSTVLGGKLQYLIGG